MKKLPTYKVCRRLGAGVFDKCQTQKFMLAESKKNKKREHGRGLSDFAKQLIEKQRVRFAYGIPERQLSRYVEDANRVAVLGTDPRTRMTEQLELRLDNVVYRLGLTRSRRAARQLVSHGHVQVNGKRTTIPSRELALKDTITLRERTQALPIMERIKDATGMATAPTWLSFDANKFEGVVRALPNPENTELPGSVDAILEYYSR
jgi:small subunit ribosomal protein S4